MKRGARSMSLSTAKAVKVSELQFDNRNLRNLPLDPKPFSLDDSRSVPNAIWAKVNLQPTENPRLVAYSEDALALLGIDKSQYEDETALEADIEKYLGGNEVIPNSGSEPYSHCYCGHQFGNFAGQLGDGASMYLGEVSVSSSDDKSDNKDYKSLELTLKGAGKTPFSRRSDGRKVLRSSIREFLGSEALHHLGVPTTRSGSCVTSSSTVERDPFYDGRVQDEPVTVITRIAPNFFRFGSFEIFKQKESDDAYDRPGPSAGNEQLKRQLLDHIASDQYFPPSFFSSIPPFKADNDDDAADAATAATNTADTARYKAFLQENVKRAAKLVAAWDCLGFVHGVLNTDNMSVLGLTIDYGPYAFIEHFDPDFTPNGSDGSGRYTYEKQAEMVKWNLVKLGEALDPLVAPAVAAEAISAFEAIYDEEYISRMLDKLGLSNARDGDKELIKGFFTTLAACNTDFTDAFHALSLMHEILAEAPQDTDLSLQASTTVAADELVDRLVMRSAAPSELSSGLKRKMRIHRLNMQPQQVQMLHDMLQSDPDKVREMFGGASLEAVAAEVGGEKAKLDRLVACSEKIKRLESLTPALKASGDRLKWEKWVDQYIERIELDNAFPRRFDTDLLSVARERRAQTMREANPTFVLRNWVSQDAITLAEKGDYSGVRLALKMLQTPFEQGYSTFANADANATGAGQGGKDRDMNRDLKSSLLQGTSTGKKAAALPQGEKKYASTPPSWADSLLTTCSS